MVVDRLEYVLGMNTKKFIKDSDKAERKVKGMSQGMARSLKGLAATFGATLGVAVIGAAVKSLTKLGAATLQQQAAFANMARNAGLDSKQMLSELQTSAAGTISSFQLMQKASTAMAMGLPMEALPRMMEIARASAAATGQSVSFMFDSIVTGTARQSRMILDNLGIIVKAEDLYTQAAKDLGRELTEQEKRQVFLNGVMSAGADIIAKVGDATLSSQAKLERLGATYENVKRNVGLATLKFVEQTGILETLTGLLLRFDLERISFEAAAFADAAMSVITILGKLADILSIQAEEVKKLKSEYAGWVDIEKVVAELQTEAVARAHQHGTAINLLNKAVHNVGVNLGFVSEETEKGVGFMKQWVKAYTDAAFIGPIEFIGPVPAPPPPVETPDVPTMPEVKVTELPYEGMLEAAKEWWAESQKIEANRYQWMWEQGAISKDKYIAFLNEKLAEEEDFSSDWITIQSQIEAVTEEAGERDKRRWEERIAAQEQALEMLLAGYDAFSSSILNLDMTGAERRRAIFDSIARSFVAMTSDILRERIKDALLSKKITAAGQRSEIAAIASGVARKTALFAAEGAAAVASAGKWIYSAVVKMFQAHAGIPFVGVAIAAGLVATMMAAISKFKSFAEGGFVKRPGIVDPGEFVIPERIVKIIGVPALESMKRTGQIPTTTTEGAIIVNVGDVTIAGTGEPSDLFLMDEFKDGVVEAVKEGVRSGKLELT